LFSFRGFLIGGIGVLVIGVISWGVLADFGGKPHLAGISCGKCHLSDTTVSPAQAKKLVASQEVICGSCHAKALQMSHPSGFVPQGKLPAEYPVDWKGDLTCSTCHEVHGTKPGLLRGDKRGKALCLSCHDQAFFEHMKDTGNSLQQSGHLGVGIALGSQIAIDPISLQCMGCHNGESDAAGVRVDRSGVMRHSSGAANHPIGIPYPAFVRNGDLRPRSALSKKILLPDGKLSCVSCHQVYKKQHGQLVMSNNGSALCMQCHNL